MKSYEEMSRNVISRINEHEEKVKKQRSVLTKVIAPIGCVCLIALAGVGISQFKSEPPTLIDDAVYPGIKDTFDESRGEEPNKNIIVINELEEIPADQEMLFALHTKDRIEMTPEELNEYYGTNVFPSVPSDLVLQEGFYGIYKGEGGTGELYWDVNKIQYSPERARRWIAVNVQKGRIPVDFMGVFNNPEGKSVINNVEVGIGRIVDEYADIYYAEFMYKNVGFKICADSVTEEELVSIIASLLN